MDDEITALLKLVLAGGAAIPRRGLLDAHVTALRSMAAGAPSWRAAGLNESQIQRLRRPDEEPFQRAMQWLQLPGHHLLGWQNPDYPALLRRIASPPLALFVDGDPALLWHAGVAVVGSRSPTAGGR
ncbi:MAG: DNA-processing protein DprA, partial [Pseudoxanthomonas sp.]